MLSTQARSAFVSIDEGRAGSRGSSLGIRLCFVCADDLLERCVPSVCHDFLQLTKMSKIPNRLVKSTKRKPKLSKIHNRKMFSTFSIDCKIFNARLDSLAARLYSFCRFFARSRLFLYTAVQFWSEFDWEAA